MSEAFSSEKRRRISLWYWGAAGLILLAFFFYWLLHWRFIAYTDDAYVQGNQVVITPLRAGFVTAIYTDDSFLVREGELLVELDSTDAEIALEEAGEELAQAVRSVCQAFHQAFAYEAEISVRQAELVRASQDFEHRFAVLDRGAVSLEEYQHAVAALRSSFYALQRSESLYSESLAYIQGSSISNHPSVLSASERVRKAWVELYRCKIYSPAEGLAAQRRVQVGMWSTPGEPLMSVIPLEEVWVNANYKETQMRQMRLGQPATLTSDLYGGSVVYHGKIVGIPGGAGNAFSLLPPQNLSGNWIKIVQRLPVRIALDPEELKTHPLRLGLSMEVTTDLREQGGGYLPLTTEGSPTYKTTIYALEEVGDAGLIERIIQANLDPRLREYANTPYTLRSSCGNG